MNAVQDSVSKEPVGPAARGRDSSRQAVVVHTPAKINLGLRVLSRRPDGYHEIRTLLAAVDLWDTLSFEPGGDALRLECDDPSIPADKANLVLRAASRLEELLGRRLPGARIRLRKRIPAGRGLGGGSSDAAATLIGLNRLFGLGLSRHQLRRLLADVGMDAPFFLYGGLALAAGRGEQVFPLSGGPRVPLVILVPQFGIPTPDAYRGLPRQLTETPGEGPDRLVRFLVRGPEGIGRSGELLPGCFLNDLERSSVLRSVRPPGAISVMRRALTAAGATATAMSGSGSAVFGVFPDRERAARAASGLSGDDFRAIATRTIARSEHRTGLFGNWPDGAWPRG